MAMSFITSVITWSSPQDFTFRDREPSEEDDLARLHRGGQLLVGDRESRAVALEIVVCHEFQVLALLELNLAPDTLPEEASPNLRALGIQQDADWPVGLLLASLADPLHCRAVPLMIAVREVQPADVQSCTVELHQHVNVPTTRAHGADDLGFALHGVLCVSRQRRHGLLVLVEHHWQLRVLRMNRHCIKNRANCLLIFIELQLAARNP
jgi:hypothetical protein